jgi:hypothetical protein
MPALIGMLLMAGVALSPAVEVKDKTVSLDTSKITVEAVYKFND